MKLMHGVSCYVLQYHTRYDMMFDSSKREWTLPLDRPHEPKHVACVRERARPLCDPRHVETSKPAQSSERGAPAPASAGLWHARPPPACGPAHRRARCGARPMSALRLPRTTAWEKDLRETLSLAALVCLVTMSPQCHTTCVEDCLMFVEKRNRLMTKPKTYDLGPNDYCGLRILLV